MNTLKVKYEVGNSIVATIALGTKEWSGGVNVRTYINLESNKTTKALKSLYEIKAGSTRDPSFEIDGIVFGYNYGIDVNSHCKRTSVREAAKELASKIIKEQPELLGLKKVIKTKSSIMLRAWEIAREAVKKFGGKVKEYFAMSLKMAWLEV